jgi:pimeloyl-ACP methyl ester carboxylesterase
MFYVKIAGLLLLVAVGALCAWLYSGDADRKTLEAEYAAPPSTFLPILGLRLHVRDTGNRNAPALIFLHGFGSSLQTWEYWAEALSAHYRVVRFDLPGFGLTGADPTGDYTDARAVQVLLALMDALGIHQATLIGNSLGGKIAWQFAAAHPERVRKLVLISPDGYESPGFEYGKKPDVPAVMQVLPYVLNSYLVRMNLTTAFADPRKMTPALVQRYKDMMLAPGVRRAMLARMGQVVLQPPGPFLRRIEVPTLLMWGERDTMIPYSNAKDYMAALPHARLVTFADLGHVPQEEAPDRALPALEKFLMDP